MGSPANSRGSAGLVVQELVNRISHRGGATLAIMGAAQVTLQHVLLLTRLREAGTRTVSALAEDLNVSRPTASLAVERLVQLGLAGRAEDADDRRRKIVNIEEKGTRLLERLTAARAAEYDAALNKLSPALREKLAAVAVQVLDELRVGVRQDLPANTPQ